MNVASKDFYSSISPFSKFSDLTEASHYRTVPADWWVVITDVKGSTEAIANNRYKDVNLLGASSIIAIINALKGQEIPFVFGGDGATLLVHESDVERIKPALLGTQRLARDVMNFELRIGLVPIHILNARGASVEVAKFAISDKSRIAMMRGGGLTVAERMVKDTSPANAAYRLKLGGPIAEDLTSFEGLSCRWEPVKAKRGEMMSLLVVATSQEKPEEVYGRVIQSIELILNETESRPATGQQTGRGVSLPSLIKEMRMHTIDQSFVKKVKRLLRIFFEVAVMRAFMITGIKTKDFSAEKYMREMGENTDYQKFDDMIRMVRDCSVKQRDAITAMLEAEKNAGEIAYGIHTSSEALMTCLVFSLDNHIHFVDGSHGGYALAAKQLKQQLRIINTAGEYVEPGLHKQTPRG